MRDTLHLWDPDILREEWEEDVRAHHAKVQGSMKLHPDGNAPELRRLANQRFRLRKQDIHAARTEQARNNVIGALQCLGVATTTEIAHHIGVKALEVGPVLKALQSCGRVSQGKRATKIDGRNRQVSTWTLTKESHE
jgi:hypothetical protein